MVRALVVQELNWTQRAVLKCLYHWILGWLDVVAVVL